MATLNSLQLSSLKSTYCSKCYLATPIWKGTCIHCKAKLPSDFEPRAKKFAARAGAPRPSGD